MTSVAFQFSPKIHNAFGLLLIETMSSRTFKDCPIWSHWLVKGLNESKERFAIRKLLLLKALYVKLPIIHHSDYGQN